MSGKHHIESADFLGAQLFGAAQTADKNAIGRSGRTSCKYHAKRPLQLSESEQVNNISRAESLRASIYQLETLLDPSPHYERLQKSAHTQTKRTSQNKVIGRETNA